MATGESIFYQAPRGHYPLTEAAWIVGLRPRRISGWVSKGHACASQQGRPPLVFSYQDLAELLLIHDLLKNHSVPWQEIADTIEGLQEDHKCWPLSRESLEETLSTIRAPRGKRSGLVVERGGQVFQRRGRGWQQLLNPKTLGLITDRLEHGGWAALLEPSIKHIAIDPDFYSGRPTIRGRRISAVDVATLAEDPGGETILLDNFRLQKVEIDDAVTWWRATQRARQNAA